MNTPIHPIPEPSPIRRQRDPVESAGFKCCPPGHGYMLAGIGTVAPRAVRCPSIRMRITTAIFERSRPTGHPPGRRSERSVMSRFSARWVLGLALCLSACSSRADEWTSGPWHIRAATNGAPDSPSCPIEFPGGVATGNVLAIHYALAPDHVPQLWAFLTDGFWRQTAQESEFLTSYRLFKYFSSDNVDRDRLTAERFRVLGTNAAGELELELAYSNNAAVGDRFRVAGLVTLERPDMLQTAMRAEITVSNATGIAVTPFWQGHRDLAEQWELFGVSSMYVADNLTGGLPAWYDGLDPAHQYVGITNDASYLNDGYSANGAIVVATHDAKHIVASNAAVALNRDTNLCPVVVVPGYEWYAQLVLRGEAATDLRVQHAYETSRNHRVQILSCSGLTAAATNLKWAATYNRDDANMVDGDNVQIKLGMDDFLDGWPAQAVQTLHLRMTAGNARPVVTSLAGPDPNNLTIGWTTEPGERYNLQHVATLAGAWSNLVADVAGPDLGPMGVPAGFLRISETVGP